MGIQGHIRTSDDIIRRIAALVPPGTPTPLPLPLVARLRGETAELLSIMKADGRLDESPMKLAMERSVDLHEEAAAARIRDRVVLVTGGAGCVGSRLIPLIARLGASKIVIVDSAEDAAAADPERGTTTYRVDIRDMAAMDAVFADVKPDVVFHLASIREPGRAEAVVREAIETNVFGTRNVIAACLRHGVGHAIYSSTGKCFAYITDHVYTGSKKLAEAQWAIAARTSTSTVFRCTRFTHIMENGLVTHDIMEGIEKGLVGLHGSDRNFNIQNLRQATHLLVNALALSDETPVDGFWSAIDLGWPVNTMELALYHIDKSGRDAAVYFLGVPKGYDESFFRGQFNWNDDFEYHPLVNALEGHSGFSDSSGTMIGARIQPFSAAALDAELVMLQKALDDASLDVDQVKGALLRAVMGLSRAIFSGADLSRVIDILWWGAAPEWSGPMAQTATRFAKIIGLLADVVADRIEGPIGAMEPDIATKLLDIVETLSQVPALAEQRTRIDRILAAPKAA